MLVVLFVTQRGRNVYSQFRFFPRRSEIKKIIINIYDLYLLSKNKINE